MDFADVNRPALVLAAVCLAVAGGSDNVSSIFRQTILQTAVPDHLRGRTQGVFTVVVTGGPRLGQMFAGTLATLTATWVPSLVGGVLVVVLVWLGGRPGARRSATTTPSIRGRDKAPRHSASGESPAGRRHGAVAHPAGQGSPHRRGLDQAEWPSYCYGSFRLPFQSHARGSVHD